MIPMIMKMTARTTRTIATGLMRMLLAINWQANAPGRSRAGLRRARRHAAKTGHRLPPSRGQTTDSRPIRGILQGDRRQPGGHGVLLEQRPQGRGTTAAVSDPSLAQRFHRVRASRILRFRLMATLVHAGGPAT